MSQTSPPSEIERLCNKHEDSRMNDVKLADDYGPAICRALLWQVILAVLAGLMLDQGQTARAFGIALICHWAVILIILHRRPLYPTRLDLAITGYGTLPLLMLIMTLGPWLLRRIGTPPYMIP